MIIHILAIEHVAYAYIFMCGWVAGYSPIWGCDVRESTFAVYREM